jgi:ATP-dependent Clp protease ATP-binding subunit ClpA
MSPLLTEKGLAISAFEPVLAAVLGNKPEEWGAAVLAEADALGHSQVQLRDWLYCLVRSPGTSARRLLIDAVGRKPEQLINGVEAGIDTDEESQGPAPLRLTVSAVSPAVIAALDAAERLAHQNNWETITDPVLTLALLETADEMLLDLLTKWVKEEGMSALLAQLRSKVRKREGGAQPLFEEEGRLNPRAFSPSGWQFGRRMAEDASSLGTKKITTRHMLYTLLGHESGALCVGLALRGIDVKRELHSRLSAELARGGRKRNDTLELIRDAIFDPAIRVLEAARSLAEERGVPGIGELDIARAFIARQPGELMRLFS